MKNKLIRDINEGTWRKFVGFCKIKGIKVGDELDNILKTYMKKNLNKLLR